MPWSRLSCLLLLLCVVFVRAGGLSCWVCIADDCHLSPVTNYKASRKLCRQEESCQKVEYRGKDVATGKTYYSVVRSCSQGTCRPKLSFNCTEKLLVNPGCMIRHCCNEADLCNGCRSAATLWDYQLPLLALAVNVFVHAHWNIISW